MEILSAMNDVNQDQEVLSGAQPVEASGSSNTPELLVYHRPLSINRIVIFYICCSLKYVFSALELFPHECLLSQSRVS